MFIFRHTGDSADLICEALKEAREFAKQRQNNPKARAKRPFEVRRGVISVRGDVDIDSIDVILIFRIISSSSFIN